MTKREEQIGMALAAEMGASFEELNFGDMMVLRAAYSSGKGWAGLTPALKERFAQLGVKFLQRLTRMTVAG